MARAQIYGLARIDPIGDIVEHAVAQIDGIVQTDQAARRSVLMGEILKYPLSADTGIGVFTDRHRGDIFVA